MIIDYYPMGEKIMIQVIFDHFFAICESLNA